MNRRLPYFQLAAAFAAGVVLTAAAFVLGRPPTLDLGVEGERHMGQRQYVNPLLDCPSLPRGLSPNKANLQMKLAELIKKHEEEGGVDQVALLFRDLNNGPIFSINSKQPFIGASLLKLPILIAMFKRRAEVPNLFEQKLKFEAAKDANIDRQATILPSYPALEEGKEYPVGELLARMIVDSDNFATALLLRYFPEADITLSLKDMGLPVSVKGDEVWLSVEDYAGVFRILYNATYLGHEASNAVLAMMTQSTFDQGLEAGVAAGIPVSHKFGEREVASVRQFHDCGIVYYPARPYLLCVMTRGTQQQKLIQVIAEISRAVFDQVKNDSEVR